MAHAHQGELTKRAEELAAQDAAFRGPGRFTSRHYKMALREVSPEAREQERGLIPTAGQVALRDAKYLIEVFAGKGLTREQAEEKLKETHPRTYRVYADHGGLQEFTSNAGVELVEKMQELGKQFPAMRQTVLRDYCLLADPALRERVARTVPDAARAARAEAQRYGKLTGGRARAYGNQPSNQWHVLLAKLNQDEVVALVAANKLSADDAREWVERVLVGPKPLNLPVAASLDWDAKIGDAVRAITDAAELIRFRAEGRKA